VPTPIVRPIFKMPMPAASSSRMRASMEAFTGRRPSFIPFALARTKQRERRRLQTVFWVSICMTKSASLTYSTNRASDAVAGLLKTLEPMMTKSSLFLSSLLVLALTTSFAAAAAAKQVHAAPRVIGREVPAPPWSFACMNDRGPTECGEPMWVYGSPATGAR
jgi:hypothetical protein